MKTLLIDDDPFALELLALQLQRLGCVALTSCERARDALDLLETRFEAISLVFCDLQMPGIDGVEFVRHLALISYRGGLVLVSGEDERIPQTVNKLVQEHHIHMLGALTNPISTDRLRELLVSHACSSATPNHALRHRPGADELRRAIIEGELVNHYQPRVALSTAALGGVEAPVRWQHPQAGMDFPDQFITTAEEHGLIDDVGTGHSSLAQLRDIPFDELKLDRSFINGAARDPSLRAIIDATLAMAGQVGMKAVAEGVEDRADWDGLRALGRDVAQGYFIARPMPGADLPAWRADWQLRRVGLRAIPA